MPQPPAFSLTLDQVRDSGLLSVDRMAAVEAEIERRLSIPLTPDGRPITSARLADMGEYGLHLYPVMTHESNWEYARRQLLAIALTEEERTMLGRHALAASAIRRERAKMEKAAKIPEADWGGPVYYGDNYYDSVEECLEAVWDNGGETPLYVWPAIPRSVVGALDVSETIQGEIEENGWEDFDEGDLHGIDDLQRALDAFVMANRGVTAMWPDETRIIVVDREKAVREMTRLGPTDDSLESPAAAKQG